LSTSDGRTTENHARRIGSFPKWPISAYSASTPVMESTTAPSATKDNHFEFEEEMHGPVRVERLQHIRVSNNAAHA
jgi:hypothetical protein